MAAMAMGRPLAPKSCSAMAAARAEAPMLTSVMPTRSVTSSSWGCASSGRERRRRPALLLGELA